MEFDKLKPVFIKKQFVEQKTGNVYPAGDRPYRLEAIPPKFLLAEYCTQDEVLVEKVKDFEPTITVKPMSNNLDKPIEIRASTIVIKSEQLPPSIESLPPTVEVLPETIEPLPIVVTPENPAIKKK